MTDGMFPLSPQRYHFSSHSRFIPEFRFTHNLYAYLPFSDSHMQEFEPLFPRLSN